MMTKNVLFLMCTAVIILLSGCAVTTEEYERVPYVEDGTLDAELSRITNEVAGRLADEDLTRVGVLEMKDFEGRISEFGTYVAEEITARLHLIRDIEVIEMHVIKEALLEMEVDREGPLDAETLSLLAGTFGLEALIDGTVTDLGDRVGVDINLIDTEERESIDSFSAVAPKDRYIEDMMDAYEDPVSEDPLRREEIDHDTRPGVGTAVGDEEVAYPQTEVDGFAFEVISAELDDDDGELAVRVMITNQTGSDREIGIDRETSLIDEMGNEYQNPARIINSHIAGGLTDVLRHNFYDGAPVILTLEFVNVEPHLQSIALLSIRSNDLSTDVTLRDIPLLR